MHERRPQSIDEVETDQELNVVERANSLARQIGRSLRQGRQLSDDEGRPTVRRLLELSDSRPAVATATVASGSTSCNSELGRKSHSFCCMHQKAHPQAESKKESRRRVKKCH